MRRINWAKMGVMGVLLTLLITATIGQTDWVWQGSCNTQGWYDTCTIGRCGSGNRFNLVQNNWGRTRCSNEGSPAFPGVNDIVIIPAGATVRINGDVNVARIEIQQGATLIWQSGDLIVGELVNEGVLEWANRVGWYDPFRGRLVNRGLWRVNSSEFVELENARLVNEANGVLELVVARWARNAGSVVLENAGVVRKVSPDANTPTTATLQRLELTGVGTVQVQSGELALEGCTVSGGLRFTGTGQLAIRDDLTVASGATLTTALAEGGVARWLAGDVVVSSGGQWVNEGVLEWANRVGWYDPFRGRLVNRGLWRKTTSESVELENAQLVNEAGGVLELALGTLARNAGSVVLENAGVVRKVSPDPNNPSTVNIVGVACSNSGEWVVADGALGMQNSTFTQTDGKLLINGALNCNNPLILQGGALEGLGALTASVNNLRASVRPGDGNRRGTLTIQNGNYTQGADAELEIEISGTNSSEYDRLIVFRSSSNNQDVGRVTLDSKLRVVSMATCLWKTTLLSHSPIASAQVSSRSWKWRGCHVVCWN